MPRYLLSWSTPADRLYDVAVRFTAPVDTPRLLLPAWRPGRYLLQNYAANVREWTAGEARAWKDGKTSWRIDARAGEEVTFRYRYYAGVLDAGSSFLDDDEAYFNGTNLFMLVEGLRGEEHLLTIAAPSDWMIETQLPREDSTFRARDYDHLIDSTTIAAATLTRHSFSESGARFHLVFRGDEGIDTEAYVGPLRAIAKTQARLFGGFPFSEYRFLYHVRDRWHGVEHEDSCSIVVRRSAILGGQLGDEGFDHVLSISSHELFHAWNVKRMLPAAFLPYDYWQEAPTRLLWAMEGLTSYYGDLSLVRSGLWSVERYLTHLAKEIETLEGLPAREHLSLAQASFDGWLSDPAQMHDHPNAFFSFYNKGEIVAALLDLTIRRATNGMKSLDDVLRLLWEEYGLAGRGMEEDAVERTVARVVDVGDFFARHVEGTDPLPYAELFATAGVAFATAARQPDQASLGAKLKMQDGLLIVESAMRGAAGVEAGLLPNDELLALDGNRLTNIASLENAMRALKLGDSAELLIARAGVVRPLSLKGRPDPRPTVAMRAIGASELRRGWLWRDE
ncbi:MAG TPA: PDZ domain-containing protein [Thermoanaerobaculia bacterium]|jgi:predicted metalloprotease with PDZ domain|nr:PDZ domain-containing protein [Thermoanaerobaculia bacterium]